MSRSQLSPDLPTGPPPEVLEEVALAWERAQEPFPDDVRLDFGADPGSGRAWGELRLADGTLLELVTASEAIAIACGDAAVRRAALPV